MTSPTPRSPVIRVFDCHIARPAGVSSESRVAGVSNESRTVGGGYEFLLLRRSASKIYAGDWRMVGGKIEAGESAWQACLRELAEETGLSPKRLLTVPYLNRFYEWEADRVNEIPVFVAVVEESEPQLDDEHDGHEWLGPEAACARLAWPGQREGLRAALALLTENEALQRHLEIPLDPKAHPKG